MGVDTYCMLLHLSQLSGIFLLPLGVALPIIMWAANKDSQPVVDAHGRRALNWLISLFIYGVVSAILAAIYIGLLALIGLVCLGIAFPIIGAVKAHAGQAWSYPLAIKFLKEPAA